MHGIMYNDSSLVTTASEREATVYGNTKRLSSSLSIYMSFLQLPFLNKCLAA